MASIRTVQFGKKKLEWNTSKIYTLHYSPDEVSRVFNEIISPNLKINNKQESSIKIKVFKFVEDLLPDLDMSGFCTLITALRETVIDVCSDPDEEGYYKIERRKYKEEFHNEYERKTYFNVGYHMNHHCKQLYQCCFIGITYYDWGGVCKKNLAYTTGEWKDNTSNAFLDSIDLFRNKKENINKRS